MSKKKPDAQVVAGLRFEPPSSDAPGYLLRVRRSAEFATAQREGKLTPQAWDALVEFLLDYVTEPRNRDAARDLLWQCSEREFNAMLDALNGKKAAPPLPNTAQ